MYSGNDLAERRKFKRYLAKERAFAVLGPDFKKFGQIIDISRDGLSYRYIAEGARDHLLGNSLEVDIFFGGEDFYLERLSLIPISDSAERKGFSVRSIMRRQCLQFDELMPNQVPLLEYFIQKYTVI